MAEQEGKTIHSVAKAIRLLDLLTAAGQPASLTELYQKTGWPKSTIHGLLSTMRESGLIEQTPNGRYWAGHPAVVMEVSSDGKILSRTEYDTGVKRPHSQFRQVNKNTRGNYLVPIISTSEVHEISPEGKLVKITKVEGNPFTVLSSKGKNYWVACGDAHILLEANLENGKVIRRYAEHDIEGTNLYFVAGLFPSAKGGIYVCNWQGHSRNAKETNSPQLFEIDKKGKMVWSLNDHEAFGMISAVSTIR